MTISAIGVQTLAIHAGMIAAFAAVVIRRIKRERYAAEVRAKNKAAYAREIAEIGRKIKRQMMAAAAANAPLLNSGSVQTIRPGSRGTILTQYELEILFGGVSNGAE